MAEKDQIEKLVSETDQKLAEEEKLKDAIARDFHFTQRDLQAFAKLRSALLCQEHTCRIPKLAEAIDTTEHLLTHLIDGNLMGAWAEEFPKKW